MRAVGLLVVGLLLVSCGPPTTSRASGRGPTVVMPARSAPMPVQPGIPVRLTIPSLGIDSPVQPVGLMPDGSVGTPCDPTKPKARCNVNATAWYTGSVKPGQPGSAVIDGHVDWYGPAGSGRDIPAVFAQLHRIRLGDKVVVFDRVTGRTFIVDRITTLGYPRQPADTYDISGPAVLTLITCAGVYVNSSTGMSQRLYVHARLI